MEDYYSTLGINQTATQEEIKKAYKKLAFRFHPDVCKDFDAHDKFIKINEAYEFLSNQEKKDFYDNLRRNNSKSSKKTSQYQKWQDNARSSAKKHAKTEFSKFKESVHNNFTEAYKTTKKGVNIGCALYFGLTFLGSAIFGIYKLIELLIRIYTEGLNFSFWLIPYFLMIMLFAYIGYLSIKGAFEQ